MLPLMFCCILPFPHIPDVAAPPSQVLFSHFVRVLFVFWLLLRQSKVCAPHPCVTPASVSLGGSEGELLSVFSIPTVCLSWESTNVQVCVCRESPWPWHRHDPCFSDGEQHWSKPHFPHCSSPSHVLSVSLSQVHVFTMSTN